MKSIPLTQGKVALVDDADFDKLSKHKWCAYRGYGTTFYAARGFRAAGKHITVKMHHVIIDRLPGEHVDHCDGDGLNNTRANLRIATKSQNAINSRHRSDNSSGYKGVTFHYRRKKWMAQIGINGKNQYLGYFSTPEGAYKVYCEAAKKLHGKFSRVY